MKKQLLFSVLLIIFAGIFTPYTVACDVNDLTICSFNIQFLGNPKGRDNEALASILIDYDIVVIQELVASPVAGTYPDGDTYTSDTEAAIFFNEMQSLGFNYTLSEEDTGTGDKIHKASSATEWWVTFYKPEAVKVAEDLPHGFLAEDRSNHPCYERVPYAFAFRTIDDKADFVLISVHLKPNGSKESRARRRHELAAVTEWIYENDNDEKDFIILGDMNIEDAEELAAVVPYGYASLNDECAITNTNTNKPKPYDHVFYNVSKTREINTEFDFKVVNLIEAMKPYWQSDQPYPGDPYNHNEFRKHYSDHHPVLFKITIPQSDDD